jgi:flavodoxin
MKSIIILYSYHHHSTEKVAKAIAPVLGAEIKLPEDVNPEELREYDLIGFGSGIYDSKHHVSLFELVDRLEVIDKKVFLFSTAGVSWESKVATDHSALREKLQSKGYVIIDEFQCKGFNTNSFLRLFGGINKGRPNAEDLKNAEEFAENLK